MPNGATCRTAHTAERREVPNGANHIARCKRRKLRTARTTNSANYEQRELRTARIAHGAGAERREVPRGAKRERRKGRQGAAAVCGCGDALGVGAPARSGPPLVGRCSPRLAAVRGSRRQAPCAVGHSRFLPFASFAVRVVRVCAVCNAVGGSRRLAICAFRPSAPFGTWRRSAPRAVSRLRRLCSLRR